MKICPQCKMHYPDEASRCSAEGALLEPATDPRIGTLVAGRYVIEQAIGEGGMATVYRARHRLTDKHVAVKVMNPMLAANAVVRERFRREARSAEKLAHPNIIEIFDQGDTEDGTAFIAMELLEGEPLAAAIARGPLDVDRALRVMIQVARGVARAHDLEIVHRDIKPDNIFLCRRKSGAEVVKVLDFGIAKSHDDARLTSQGELFGTPQYMAPERIGGKEATGASDIYALGVVFFEMLTGGLPWDAHDIPTFFAKHMEEPPPPVRDRNRSVPARLDALVERMLAKKPDERPADVHHVHRELLEILDARDASAPPPAREDSVRASGPIAIAAGGTGDRWPRRLLVLEAMLERAFGARARAPGELTALLDESRGLVRDLASLRKASLTAQEALEAVDARGRARRAELGAAADRLGVDASKAREALRAARDALRRHEDEARGGRERFEAAHKNAMFWEGRSGFEEPSPDLARAYRDVADAVDAWAGRAQQARRAREAVLAAERVASELDAELHELRTGLTAHEQELDASRAKCEGLVRSHGSEIDRLEAQLQALTVRFCEPLRAKPELGALFEELAAEAAA